MSNPRSPVRNVPPPDGPAKPSYARFIPREEVQSYAAWNPKAFDPALDQRRGGDRRNPAAPAAPPPPPTPEEQRAAVHAARQSGYQDGYRDGLAALEAFKQSHAAQLAGQIGAFLASFDRELTQLESDMAQALARTATELARQVVRDELTRRPELVAGVAREALGALLLGARHVLVRVHPDDLHLVAQGAAEEIERRGARLAADPAVARGGCVVESDAGIVDAEVETRWQRAASTLGDASAFGDSHARPARLDLIGEGDESMGDSASTAAARTERRAAPSRPAVPAGDRPARSLDAGPA